MVPLLLFFGRSSPLISYPNICMVYVVIEGKIEVEGENPSEDQRDPSSESLFSVRPFLSSTCCLLPPAPVEARLHRMMLLILMNADDGPETRPIQLEFSRFAFIPLLFFVEKRGWGSKNAAAPHHRMESEVKVQTSTQWSSWWWMQKVVKKRSGTSFVQFSSDYHFTPMDIMEGTKGIFACLTSSLMVIEMMFFGAIVEVWEKMTVQWEESCRIYSRIKIWGFSWWWWSGMG